MTDITLQDIERSKPASYRLSPEDGLITRRGTTFEVRIGASLEDIERLIIPATVAYYLDNKPKAAQALGISLKTLYIKLRKFGVKL